MTIFHNPTVHIRWFESIRFLKIPLLYHAHWNQRLRCKKMNRKSPLYHSYIEFVKSIGKAQSPLYFAVLYWAELSLYDMVRLRVIQNMRIWLTQISFGFNVYYDVSAVICKNIDKNRCILVRTDAHLALLCHKFKKYKARLIRLCLPGSNWTMVVTWQAI